MFRKWSIYQLEISAHYDFLARGPHPTSGGFRAIFSRGEQIIHLQLTDHLLIAKSI
jgi:hypothetical protein